MPLESGSDDKTIRRNVKKLILEGKPPKQAVAIAYSMAKKSRKKKKK